MLLPQTEAFNLLKNRLQCVPNYWGITADTSPSNSIEAQSLVDFKSLLAHFQSIQRKHQLSRINQRKRNVALWENGLPKA